jgi:leucyl aminopeptidase (aminopeptidase T)
MSLASQIVNKCLKISDRDNITIMLYPHNIPLAEEIASECFRKGADVLLNLYTEKYLLSYMKELSVESLKEPSIFCKALTENSTVLIWAGATYDPAVLREIPPEKEAASSQGEAKAHWPLQRDRKVRSLAIGLSLVTPPRAKAYGFNFKRWESVMMEASSVDHDKLAVLGGKLKTALSMAKHLRITSAEGTDLAFEVSGRPWYVSDGVIDKKDIAEGHLDDHIPAGNIYVAPLETTVDGNARFNVKEPYRGRSIGEMKWAFKGGKLKEFKGDASIARLKEDWGKSAGDKDRMAYFSIGFNPSAKTGYTINQVASGAVSIGLGGNEDLGGVNKPGFFYVGTLTGTDVTADGKTIVKKGKIVLQ